MAAKKQKKLPKKRVEVRLKINLKTIVIGLLFVFLFLPFILSVSVLPPDDGEITISQALSDIREEKISKVEIQENKLFLTYSDDTVKVALKEDDITFSELLSNSDINPESTSFEVVDQSAVRAIAEVIGIVLPIGLMALFFLYILRSQNRGAQDVFSFGKSKARLFAKGKQDVTFSDVAGVDDAKKELEEVVDFLKNPTKYRKIGARTPKGVLLFGPSGVGKTMLAKAVAGEAEVPFFSMAGSEFMEILVGVGASRVRDLFANAKKSAPSIIFIDEIDAIGRQRGRGMMGGHDEREQTLNQILVEMDGFTPNDNVMVIAATNRGDLLDPALLRPGRFDRRVVLDMPDKEGREDIVKIHARGKKFVKGIEWGKIADRTVGFSGADIENMLNEAAIAAARDDKKEIAMADVEEAATKVKLGPAKKRLQRDEDKKITAFHEAGHAVVSHMLVGTDPVERISIVARGMSLGHTLIPPAADRAHETKSRMLDMITAMLGGRAAEEVVFNEMTSGASNDIERATQVARAMVSDYGMSSLGPINLGPQHEMDEFGKTMWYEPSSVSPHMQEMVDMEVKKIMDASYKKSVDIVRKERARLNKLANALLKKETLDRDEFEKLMGK